jgi:hypothetical protein
MGNKILISPINNIAIQYPKTIKIKILKRQISVTLIFLLVYLTQYVIWTKIKKSMPRVKKSNIIRNKSAIIVINSPNVSSFISTS